MNPDPMRQHFSPYLAMGNNPVNLVDPDGGTDGCPECGDATVLDGVTVTGSNWTWWDQFKYDYSRLSSTETDGIAFWNDGGLASGGGDYFVREGKAAYGIENVTDGLVVFKGINGKQFAADGRTPLSKESFQTFKKIVDEGKFVISMGEKVAKIKLSPSTSKEIVTSVAKVNASTHNGRLAADYPTYEEAGNPTWNGRSRLGDSLDVIRVNGVLIDTVQSTNLGTNRRF